MQFLVKYDKDFFFLFLFFQGNWQGDSQFYVENQSQDNFKEKWQNGDLNYQDLLSDRIEHHWTPHDTCSLRNNFWNTLT